MEQVVEVEEVEPESREVDNGSEEEEVEGEEEEGTSMSWKEAVLKGRVGIGGGEGLARGVDDAEDEEKEW